MAASWLRVSSARSRQTTPDLKRVRRVVRALGNPPLRAAAEDLEVIVVNDAGPDLIGFYVSPAGSDAWDENLLEDNPLASGNELTVTIPDGLTQCIYDIRGVFQDGDVLEDRGLDLCELGEYSFTE